MPINNITLTKEDFDNTNWKEIFVSKPETQVKWYVPTLKTVENQAIAQGETNKAAVFRLLRAVCSLRFTSNIIENPENPFSFEYGTSVDISNFFSNEELKLLKEILPEIVAQNLLAHTADIVFVGLEDYLTALKAIEAYLKVADELELQANQASKKFRINNILKQRLRVIQRALLLSKLTDNKRLKANSVSYIDSVLETFKHKEPSVLLHGLLELLLDKSKIAEPSKFGNYATLAENAALKTEQAKDWYTAESYYQLQIRWLLKLSKKNEARAAKIRAAECFIQAGDEEINKSAPSYIGGAHQYGLAYKAYMLFGGPDDRRNEIHRKMLEFQQRSISEYGHYTMQEEQEEIDVSAALQLVKDKTKEEALEILGTLESPIIKSNLELAANQAAKNPSLKDVIPTVTHSETGKVSAVRPSLLSPGEQAKLEWMYGEATLNQKSFAYETISPVRQQITRDHSIGEADILSILTNNPFIPPGREELYIRGFLAGFAEDFITAVHILIPQFENSLRYFLQQSGVIASGFDKDLQFEWTLTKILYESETVTELENNLGEDFVFELKALFIEKNGSNLRNELSHGLLSYDAFQDTKMIYAWWIIFRICYHFFISKEYQDATENQ